MYQSKSGRFSVLWVVVSWYTQDIIPKAEAQPRVAPVQDTVSAGRWRLGRRHAISSRGAIAVKTTLDLAMDLM